MDLFDFDSEQSSVDFDKFIELGVLAAKYVNPKDYRPILAFIHIKDKVMWATDSHKMFRANVDIQDDFDDVNINYAWFKWMAKKKETIRSMCVSADRKHIIVNDIETPYELSSLQYPDIEAVYPKQLNNITTIGKVGFINAVQKVIDNCNKKDEHKTIIIEKIEDSLFLKPRWSETETFEAIPISYSGKWTDGICMFGSKVLLQLIKDVTGSYIKIEHQCYSSPFKIYGVDNSIRFLLMPMVDPPKRIQEN